jgi:hypothetical protein
MAITATMAPAITAACRHAWRRAGARIRRRAARSLGCSAVVRTCLSHDSDGDSAAAGRLADLR